VAGLLTYSLLDGSKVNCQCLGEPYISQIIEAINNVPKRESIGLAQIIQDAFDEGFFCRVHVSDGSTVEERCEANWEHSQAKANIPPLLDLTEIEGEKP
jgi:hypothetical protein